MDFRFDKEEKSLIAAAAKSVEACFPMARLRDNSSSVSRWRAIGEDGWLHAGLQESDGGFATQPHLLCAFAREAGRVVCVEQWVNNTILLPVLMSQIADPIARAAWLAHQRIRPGFLLGDGRREDLHASRGEIARTSWCFGAERDFDAYALISDGGDHRLIRVLDADLEVAPVAGLSLSVAEVALRGGSRADTLLTLDGTQIGSIILRALVVHSAAMLGVAERALALTIAHVSVRTQFGAPIGRFQVLKHMLADVHVNNEVAWNAILHASLEASPRASTVARVQAVEAALAATKTMLQLHGGIGFTWESDVHFLLKTAVTGSARFGGRDRQAASLGHAMVSDA